MAIKTETRERKIAEIISGHLDELEGMLLELRADANYAYDEDGCTQWSKGYQGAYQDKLKELRALAAEAKKALERKLEQY